MILQILHKHFSPLAQRFITFLFCLLFFICGSNTLFLIFSKLLICGSNTLCLILVPTDPAAASSFHKLLMIKGSIESLRKLPS
jgi:hypothetical protein